MYRHRRSLSDVYYLPLPQSGYDALKFRSPVDIDIGSLQTAKIEAGKHLIADRLLNGRKVYCGLVYIENGQATPLMCFAFESDTLIFAPGEVAERRKALSPGTVELTKAPT